MYNVFRVTGGRGVIACIKDPRSSRLLFRSHSLHNIRRSTHSQVSGSNMPDEDRSAVTKGLTDQATIRQLSSSGLEVKRRREELRKAREERETERKQLKDDKCEDQGEEEEGDEVEDTTEDKSGGKKEDG